MRILYIIGIVLFLSGCAGFRPVGISGDLKEDPVDTFSAFVREDVNKARWLATAANDRPAMVCYEELLNWIDETADQKQRLVNAESGFDPDIHLQGDGIVTAYQRARNLRRRIQKSVPEEVKIACAAMVYESKSFLTRLLFRIKGI